MLHFVHTFRGARKTCANLKLLGTACTLFLARIALHAHFQGSVLESVRTSFAPCAHCSTGCPVPPGSIRPTGLDKVMWSVCVILGIRASCDAHDMRLSHARRPEQNDAAKSILGQLPRGGDQAPVQAHFDQVSTLISAYREQTTSPWNTRCP